MADLSQYFKNRVKYHAASRLASQTGEGLVQALNVDGHTVSYDKVWSAPAINFPNNANKSDVNPVNATNDLVKVFKADIYDAVPISSAVLNDVQYYKYSSASGYYKVDAPTGIIPTKDYLVSGYSITSAAFHDKADNGIVWKNSKYAK